MQRKGQAGNSMIRAIVAGGKRFGAQLACGGFALVAAGATQAATVTWSGETWDYSAATTTATVNGSGHLEVTPVTTGSGRTVHFNTSVAFRAAATPFVQASFLETGANGRKGIMIEDETTSPAGGAGGWLQFLSDSAFGSNYKIFYNDYDADLADGGGINFSAGHTIDTGVARSLGERTFTVGRDAGGNIAFLIDGVLVASLTSAQFNPNYFGDVYLVGNNTTLAAATYTGFATGTAFAVPEPSTMLLVAAAGLGLFAARRRRSI